MKKGNAMYYSKKGLLALGFGLSMGNVCAMEPENWEVEKHLKKEISDNLKSIRKSFDPRDGFMKLLDKLALVDEGIIAQGVLLSDDVYNSISLILKDNLLQNKPLTVIASLNTLVVKLESFIEKIEKSMGNMDELIVNAQVNNNIVMTKAQLKQRLDLLLLYAFDILSDLKNAIAVTKESRYIQGFHDRW